MQKFYTIYMFYTAKQEKFYTIYTFYTAKQERNLKDVKEERSA